MVYRRYASLFFLVGIDEDEVWRSAPPAAVHVCSPCHGVPRAVHDNLLMSAERAGHPGVHPLPGGDAGPLLQQRLRAGPHVQPGDGACLLACYTWQLFTCPQALVRLEVFWNQAMHMQLA